MTLLALKRILMILILMLSVTAVSITTLKRVRFISGRGIITRQQVDLSAGIHMQVN